MFIDSRKLNSNEVVNADVCIVGGGPAGVTIAKELINQDFSVCLLESGDLHFDQELQSLAEGETEGDPFPPIKDMRHRQFGGMSNLWYIAIAKRQTGLRYAMLDSIDFQKRDWVSHSGWPFPKSALNDYYERAHRMCKLGPCTYDAADWEHDNFRQVRFNGDRVTTSMFQFGPRDIFTNEYRYQLNRSFNVRTYLNANVVEVEVDEFQQVKRVHAACTTGNKFSVQAKVFILAAGGIENARVLLQSNKVQREGVGNQNDVVGRYFMDHPMVVCGILNPHHPRIVETLGLYDLHHVSGVSVMGKFTLTSEVMRREKLVNMSFLIIPKNELLAENTNHSAATISLKTLLAGAKSSRLPKEALYHLRSVVTNIDDIARDIYKHKIKGPAFPYDLGHGGWSTKTHGNKIFNKFEVLSQTEQTPDPHNRVMLSERQDQFGCPLPKLINRWSESDIASIKKSQIIFGQELANAGLGQLQFEWKEERPVVGSMSTHHNMGTTRMHDDPKQGVVDANCKVHGINNLFVAGSSVFPTGGYANPTLTIVALSIRLADHIKVHMRSLKLGIETTGTHKELAVKV